MTQMFDTSDPEQAFPGPADTGSRMQRSAVPGEVRLGRSCEDAGLFYHDVYASSAGVAFAARPPGHLLVARVTNGRIERGTDGTSEGFTPGDVFVVSQPHRSYACGSPGVHLDLIGIGLAAVAAVTGDPAMAVPGCLQLTGYQPVSAAAALTWNRTADFAARQLSDNQAATSPLLAASTARLLAASVQAAFPNTPVSGPHPPENRDRLPRTVQRAVDFIGAHARQDITIADIAAAASVSARAAQLTFRRHLGTTPLEYLRRVRLEHAHAELLAADPARETVTAVAGRWGFPSPGRFAAAYRRAYGIPPSKTLRCG